MARVVNATPTSSRRAGALLAGALILLCTNSAWANPALRVQMDVEGDFLMFGNTLVHECDQAAPTIPAPIVGTIGNCPNDNNFAPDVYWRSDDPTDGSATADDSFGPADARSTAVLDLPAGANILYARIYWGGYDDTAGPDDAIRVQRPSAGLDTEVLADDQARVDNANTGRFWYQSTADVTALVQAQGEGPYRIAGVNSLDIVGLGDVNPIAAWYIVVLYELDGEPSRNLAIFDGMDLVDQNIGNVSVTLDGFLVPNAGFDAKLGVVAYEGEAQLTGDALLFNGNTLSNAVNPANNFFNASRSQLGVPLTVPGDLPQLTGGPRSLSNVDFDVVDVTSLVAAGDTSATIEATSTLDTFLLSAFVTSISTFKPDFVTSGKTVTDLNGGAVRPDDELEYEIVAVNTGNDVSIDTVVSDPLPAGVTYVPDSLEVTDGANVGAKTDVAADDQGEYDSATRTITVRIGDGANGTTGGDLAIGASSTLRFRVTVDADASGTIRNQAEISAAGERGALNETTPTDGNGVDPGQPPTEVTVDECEVDGDCAAPKPFCDVASSPRTCVACLTSSQCTTDAKPDCNFTTHVCECTGGGTCTDSDGDGISDAGEAALGSDPNDADSDDDGVPDGSELAPDRDSDGDGVPNVLDPDSDNDGLFDGTELGFGCDDPATDLAAGSCRADADAGATTTNPLDADTDHGGATDGSEDFNLNGKVDTGETDPTAGHGDDDDGVSDRDGDGLGDELEAFLHSDPDDADSDDDGALDGEEANPSADTDRDGLVNVLDVDSDNDALYDGTEQGLPCNRAATNASAGHCIADSDGGATKTSPLLRDTDGGGASDGSEDANRNGVLDAAETDPTAGHGADDGSVVDTDKDGLSDALEMAIGTDPNDADSDDDGALDGEEANPADDTDGDGMINALDVDSDDDGLFDGTELGKPCDRAATDKSKMTCVADADMGETRTSPINPDTDFGGKPDGAEDANGNGRIDGDEGDPNDPSDDKLGLPCTTDTDCGRDDSGVVCADSNVCEKGCRGSGGNGCPSGLTCSSTTMDVGTCGEAGPTMPDGGMPSTPDGGMEPMAGSGGSGGRDGAGAGGADAGPAVGTLGGGGCDCRTAGGSSSTTWPIALSLWVLYTRRKRALGRRKPLAHAPGRSRG